MSLVSTRSGGGGKGDESPLSPCEPCWVHPTHGSVPFTSRATPGGAPSVPALQLLQGSSASLRKVPS